MMHPEQEGNRAMKKLVTLGLCAALATSVAPAANAADVKSGVKQAVLSSYKSDAEVKGAADFTKTMEKISGWGIWTALVTLGLIQASYFVQVAGGATPHFMNNFVK